MSIYIPAWIIYALGAFGVVVILALACVGAFMVWSLRDFRLF